MKGSNSSNAMIIDICRSPSNSAVRQRRIRGSVIGIVLFAISALLAQAQNRKNALSLCGQDVSK